MNRQPVSSSSIKSIGFEADRMHIEFANGNVYEYTGPRVKDHYEGLIKAESAGKYFAQHVRACGQTNCSVIKGRG